MTLDAASPARSAAATPPTAAEIDLLMAVFYADIRGHRELGPIFAAAIGDAPGAWEKHEAKIASFWRNALGLEKSGYRGSPMMAHAANPAIAPRHFPIWLGLFEAAAERCLRPEQAEMMIALARRIGSSLAMGLTSMRTRQGPPVLR